MQCVAGIKSPNSFAVFNARQEPGGPRETAVLGGKWWAGGLVLLEKVVIAGVKVLNQMRGLMPVWTDDRCGRKSAIIYYQFPVSGMRSSGGAGKYKLR